MSYQAIDYAGKKVVITGAASGMGEQVRKLISGLGAEVYALDLKPIEDPNVTYVPINLANRESIDAAIAQLPDGIDSVFHCAGIAGSTYLGKAFSPLDVVTINFIGAKRFVEGIVEKMPENSSIVMVSSIAGMGWKNHIADYLPFTQIDDWDEAQAFVNENQDNELYLGGPEKANKPYTFSKESMIIYMMNKSWDLAGRKIRINTISPGATKTPMHDDFNEIVGKQRGSMMPVSPFGKEAFPEQMASAMLFLNSDMADYVSGVNLPVDYGMVAGITIQKEAPSPVMNV